MECYIMATNLLTCCTRQDDTKYRHWCACPSAALITNSSEKDATLCGYSEYSGYESSPPKKYQKLSASAGYETSLVFACNPFCSPTHFPYLSGRETTTEYNRVTEYDSSCVEQELSKTLGVITTTVYGSGSSPACGGGTSTSTSNLDYSSVSPNIYYSAISAEWEAIDNEYYSGGDCDGLLSRQYERGLVFNLDATSEDTEADALARETATEGESTSSLYETRDTGFAFTKRTVDYCVLCTNLVKGKSYNGKIPKQSRTAVVGSYGAWGDEDSDTFTITAAVGASRTHNKFHIEGGTLNESITPQDFIDESYSLDPTDYGLAASEDVITPATELDNIQGYEYQIGQNDSGDPFYVEADA